MASTTIRLFLLAGLAATVALAGCLADDDAPTTPADDAETATGDTTPPDQGPAADTAPAPEPHRTQPIVFVYVINNTQEEPQAAVEQAEPDDDCGLLGTRLQVRLVGIRLGDCA